MAGKRVPTEAQLATLREHAIKPGERLALKHGTRSEAQIRPVTRTHRRRILRQLGLSPKELDPIAKGYLDLYCRLTAKIDLADDYLARNGVLGPGGEPAAVLKVYTSWVNAARLALGRLEDHLRQTGKTVSPLQALAEEGRQVREQAEARLRAVE
jgi:hypothetical protein